MKELPKIEVQETGKREFELTVNGNVIGTSKSDCDTRFHRHFLDGLFLDAYELGKEVGRGPIW